MAENNVLEWQDREITVPVLAKMQQEFGAAETSTTAQVLGDWAYHPLIGDPIWGNMGHCDITHVPTGHRLPFRVSNPADARAIVEALQGVEVETYVIDFGVLATLECRIAILERIIPIAGNMRLGQNAPGDTRVNHLRAAVNEIRARLAERN